MFICVYVFDSLRKIVDKSHNFSGDFFLLKLLLLKENKKLNRNNHQLRNDFYKWYVRNTVITRECNNGSFLQNH